MPTSELDEPELVRLYGPWAGLTPADAAEVLADYPGPWWVAGGWAIEACTGVGRRHGDLDLEIPRVDLPMLRRHLAGRFDVWSAADGSLRPVLPADDPAGSADAVLPAGCGQVWVRPGGTEPWAFDILLMPGDHERWVFKRDPRITRPLSEALWSRDGLTYLRPEVQLLLKARRVRAKDQQDFDTTSPLLDAESRTWLRESLGLAHPGHPWITRLR